MMTRLIFLYNLDHSSAAATEGDDVIDQLFQSEIDIYNLGKLGNSYFSHRIINGFPRI